MKKPVNFLEFKRTINLQHLFDNQERLKDVIKELYDHNLAQEETKNQDRVDRMGERIQVMNSMKDSTKKELAQIRTQTQIDKIIK